MTNIEKLPFIKVKGSAEEIGYAQGKLLADRVRACFDFYTKSLFQKPKFDFEHHGKTFLDIVDRYAPEYAIEIEALAKGAGMKPWQISVLNARTEIFLQANAELIACECTALYFDGPRLLGQNWDWMKPCEELVVVMEIEREDGHRILQLTEPGILGKIGMNSAGFGVCLNILIGNKAFFSMPIHIMLRMVLDAATIEDAIARLKTMPIGTYSHMLLGSETGKWASLEFAGDEMREVDYYGLTPIHTNHYLSENRDDDRIEIIMDSKTRMKRARSLTKSLDGHDLASMKEVLLNHADGNQAICKDWIPIWHLEHGTVCSLVMDLPEKTLHITKGNPHRAAFTEYHLK